MTYRCPNCKSINVIRDRHQQRKRIYYCKDCHVRFDPDVVWSIS